MIIEPYFFATPLSLRPPYLSSLAQDAQAVFEGFNGVQYVGLDLLFVEKAEAGAVGSLFIQHRTPDHRQPRRLACLMLVQAHAFF